ncbi:MAG TPA: WG repeat-containing protein [Smithellaceae bacterium]|nr:WG repeat-containing protein [Smithellaceae bacterium]
MKKTTKIIIICSLLLCSIPLSARADHPWTPFLCEGSGLVGFKDQNGKIRIKPRYTSFTTARKLDKIVAVMEEKKGKSAFYYLTKSGKKVQKGNLYFFDNGPDCESEGFIRFRDRKADKAGLLNSEGEIAIPPVYNDLTNVRNGLVIALMGAKKKFLDADEPSGCNHFIWVDGETVLVDTRNRIIIRHFDSESPLDFFSIQISSEPSNDDRRQSFMGVDGRYYSFINYKKEFQDWLFSNLTENLSIERLLECTYHEIYFWKVPDGWIRESKQQFIKRNFELIRSRLGEIRSKGSDYIVSIGGLNPFIYDSAEFNPYYNNCGEPKEWKYPVMDVIINQKTKSDLIQDHFEFLRTDNGYKLISLTIGTGKSQ